MAELTTRFCESTGYADVSLCQYGRFIGDANKPLLPFLNENTVILYLTGGSGSMKLGTTAHNIESGMIVVLFPHQCVNCTAMVGDDPEIMWVEMKGDSLPMILLRAGLTPQKPTLIPTQSAEQSELLHLFTKLTDPDQQYGPLRANGMALQLLDSLVCESPRPCQPKIANLQQYYVEKSIRYIETKYPLDISVEDVAEYCGLNRSYLGKLFRDATGMTTQEYLIRHRMRIACSYLERGAAPIATIARSVGYPNQLHFSRAFHKVFGIPPREWQKQNRK